MNIYVANIPFAASEQEVRELFERYGKVESIRIILDRETQKSRGFAFVMMKQADEAQSAIEQLNGFNFMGKTLAVSEARQRENTRTPHVKKHYSKDEYKSRPEEVRTHPSPDMRSEPALETDAYGAERPKRKKNFKKEKPERDHFDSGRKFKKESKGGKKYKQFGDEDDSYYKIGKY